MFNPLRILWALIDGFLRPWKYGVAPVEVFPPDDYPRGHMMIFEGD